MAWRNAKHHTPEACTPLLTASFRLREYGDRHACPTVYGKRTGGTPVPLLPVFQMLSVALLVLIRGQQFFVVFLGVQ
jgi:hypothetical protein